MKPFFLYVARVFPGLGSLLLLFVLSGCADHVIYHQQKTSRDYTYIDFSRNSSPYLFRGQVGGEHMSFIKVLGFQGDRFTVTMRQSGDAGFTVYGEDACVRRSGTTAEVAIKAIDALFVIEISALSYGDYELEIAKR